MAAPRIEAPAKLRAAAVREVRISGVKLPRDPGLSEEAPGKQEQDGHARKRRKGIGGEARRHRVRPPGWVPARGPGGGWGARGLFRAELARRAAAEADEPATADEPGPARQVKSRSRREHLDGRTRRPGARWERGRAEGAQPGLATGRRSSGPTPGGLAPPPGGRAGPSRPLTGRPRGPAPPRPRSLGLAGCPTAPAPWPGAARAPNLRLVSARTPGSPPRARLLPVPWGSRLQTRARTSDSARGGRAVGTRWGWRFECSRPAMPG